MAMHADDREIFARHIGTLVKVRGDFVKLDDKFKDNGRIVHRVCLKEVVLEEQLIDHVWVNHAHEIIDQAPQVGESIEVTAYVRDYEKNTDDGPRTSYYLTKPASFSFPDRLAPKIRIPAPKPNQNGCRQAYSEKGKGQQPTPPSQEYILAQVREIKSAISGIDQDRLDGLLACISTVGVAEFRRWVEVLRA